MTALNELKKHLKEGTVYRRQDLLTWSKDIDHHLQQLVADRTLKKLRNGLYYRPKKSVFGEVPADDKSLVTSFLKDNDFLITSPNVYNSLGLGMTQLYNKIIVYNHKRHGAFKLGGKVFDFRVKPKFPKKASTEFYLVDLLSNFDEVAEDHEELLLRLKKRLPLFNQLKLKKNLKNFGTLRARKLYSQVTAP